MIDITLKGCSVHATHVDLGSTQDETNLTPMIYALLVNKKKDSYKRIFKAILQVESCKIKFFCIKLKNKLNLIRESAAISEIIRSISKVCVVNSRVGITQTYRFKNEIRLVFSAV